MFYQVVSHWSWWNALTYEYSYNYNDSPESLARGFGVLKSGVRVRVPLGRGTRVGFVLGTTDQIPDGLTRSDILPIESVIDESPVLPPDLWELALWMSKTFLCSLGSALWTICPEKFLKGEKLAELPAYVSCAAKAKVRVQNCFDPRDDKRMAFYRDLILSGDDSGEGESTDKKRTLVLFSDEIAAQKFFESLPLELRNSGEILFWPSTATRKKGATRWDAWITVLESHRHQVQEQKKAKVRVIVGPSSAVFAPLCADRIIIEDEASPGYMFQFPVCHARSLAGRRAQILGAELLLGGRMPSSKTFLRSKPVCEVSPDKKNLAFAELRRSIKINERGVEGEIPVTISLLNRTRETLADGRDVLWLLDRKGGALEVYCSQCGHAITCPNCGGLMRSVKSGERLKCYRCGHTEKLLERCPECKGQFWTGKRPGLESLKSCAERLFRGEEVLMCEGRPSSGLLKTLGQSKHRASLILGTRGALPLCDIIDIGLIGWLDIDSELRRLDYGAKFNVFNMIWDSLWRGVDCEQDRKRMVVLQCRRPAAMQRNFGLLTSKGWEFFWRSELASRSELELPPMGLMVEINLTRNDDREQFLEMLESADLLVMDPGEPDQPLWIPTHTIAPVAQALALRFHISNASKGYPTVIVHSE